MCDLCLSKLPSRRKFLTQSAAAAIMVAGAPRALADAVVSAHAPNAIAPDAALQRLVAGNARYVSRGMHCTDTASGRAARARAQYPIAGVVSCSDSRVVPEFAFDQGAGDLFVVRLAGNFIDDDGLASLEYSVAVLGVPLIVILGHSNCGAVAAAIKVLHDKARLPGHLPGLVAEIEPAVIAAEAKHPADLLAAAIAENVRRNVARLSTAKPVIAEKVKAGKLKVVGGVYHLATGKVAWL